MSYNRSNRPRSRVMQSSGPLEVVRGTASQIVEKYEALALEADNRKDRVLEQQYLQQAEHFIKEN